MVCMDLAKQTHCHSRHRQNRGNVRAQHGYTMFVRTCVLKTETIATRGPWGHATPEKCRDF